ncbi:MAG: hypothetical protein AAFP02_09050, partial [Bacteroidota bacterium]
MKKEINFISVRPYDLATRLLRNWYWFIALAGIGYAAADLFLRYQTELYEIEASIKIKEEEDNIGRQAIVQDLGFNDQVNLEDEIIALKAIPLMEEVVRQLRLDISYFEETKFRQKELYKRSPVLAAVIGDKKKAEGKSLRIVPVDTSSFLLLGGATDSLQLRYSVPFNFQGADFMLSLKKEYDYDMSISFNSTSQIAEYYSEEMNIFPVGRSKILKFSLIDAVPEKAIDLINRVVDIYGGAIVQEKNEAAKRSLEFIDERLAYITEELYRAERNVESYQRSIQAPLGIEAIADQYSTELTETNRAITELSLQKDFLAGLIQFLNTDGNEYKFLTVPAEAAGEIVSALV